MVQCPGFAWCLNRLFSDELLCEPLHLRRQSNPVLLRHLLSTMLDDEAEEDSHLFNLISIKNLPS